VSTVIVTTTVDSADVASYLSRVAVEARVAACGQVSGPITSTYWWDGELRTAQEWALVFKTPQALARPLVDLLQANHPYDVPEILVTPVTGGNPAYLEWVAEQTLPG
jgi:periplasmic divalent cation tolerance protein